MKYKTENQPSEELKEMKEKGSNVKKIRKFNGSKAFRLAVISMLTIFCFSSAYVNTEAAETKSDAASTIRMMDTEGTVGVTDSAGKDIKLVDNMRLFTGNKISTDTKSYAYFNLDDTKAVKLDSVSEAEIRKKDKKMEVLLTKGGLYLDVSKPLEQTATLNVKTSSMVMGIRGTNVSADIQDPNKVVITVYKGKVVVTVTSVVGETTTTKEYTLEGGQVGTFEVQSDQSVDADESIVSDIRTLTDADIKAYVREQIRNTNMDEEIGEVIGIPLKDVSDEDIKVMRSYEEGEKEKQVEGKQEQENNQNSNQNQNNYWDSDGQRNPPTGEGGETTNPEGGNTTTGTGQGAPGTNITDDTTTNTQGGATTGGDTNENTTNTTGGQSSGGGSGDGGSGEGEDQGDQGGQDDNKDKEYTITVNDPDNGDIEVDATKAKKDDEVKITLTPDEGYKATGVKVMAGNNEVDASGSKNSYKFTMPESDVTVSATFTKEKYEITVSDTKNGTVTCDHTTATINEKITITTKPDSGYEVDEVKVTDGDGEKVSTSEEKKNSYTFKMPGSKAAVKVTFKKKTYKITVSDTSNGSVSVDEEAAKGDEVTITTSPSEGYATDKVTVTDEDGKEVSVTKNSDTKYTFTMPGKAVKVSATFKQTSFKVTIGSATNGSLSVDKSTAAKGDTITVTTKPNDGYETEKVTATASSDEVKVSGSENTWTFTMPGSDVEVGATFKIAQYKVTISTPSNGTLTASKETAVKGETVQLTVTAATEYEVGDVSVSGKSGSVSIKEAGTSEGGSNNSGSGSGADSGSSSSTSKVYTFVMPGEDVTASATFNQKKYTVSTQSESGGSVSVDKSSAAKGETVTFTASPDEGYELDDVTVVDADGNSVSTSGNTFTMPGKSVTVKATFKQKVKKYNISTMVNPEGAGSISVASSAEEGSQVSVTVNANTSGGYVLETVMILKGNVEINSDGWPETSEQNFVTSFQSSSNSFTMPSDNVTVFAFFRSGGTYGVNWNSSYNITPISGLSEKTAIYDKVVQLGIPVVNGSSAPYGFLKSAMLGENSTSDLRTLPASVDLIDYPTTKSGNVTGEFSLPAYFTMGDNVTIDVNSVLVVPQYESGYYTYPSTANISDNENSNSHIATVGLSNSTDNDAGKCALAKGGSNTLRMSIAIDDSIRQEHPEVSITDVTIEYSDGSNVASTGATADSNGQCDITMPNGNINKINIVLAVTGNGTISGSGGN